MISVIIPAYNAEKTITKCLESLTRQTYADFELIVVNDGSTDNTAHIVASVNNDKIRLIDQPNGGVSCARNRGMEESYGEYIAFVDSDDYVSECYLEDLMSVTTEGVLAAGSLYSSDAEVVANTDVTVKTISSADFKANLCDHIQSGYVCSACCKIFDVKIIKDNGLQFKTGVKYGEDFIFVLDYLRHVSTIKILSKPLYFYVRYEDSCSMGFRANIAEEYIALSQEVNGFLGEEYPEQALAYHQRVMKDALIMLYDYYAKGQLTLSQLKERFKEISLQLRGQRLVVSASVLDRIFYRIVQKRLFLLVRLMLQINKSKRS